MSEQAPTRLQQVYEAALTELNALGTALETSDEVDAGLALLTELARENGDARAFLHYVTRMEEKLSLDLSKETKDFVRIQELLIQEQAMKAEALLSSPPPSPPSENQALEDLERQFAGVHSALTSYRRHFGGKPNGNAPDGSA